MGDTIGSINRFFLHPLGRRLSLVFGRIMSFLMVCLDRYEEQKIRRKNELHPTVKIGRGTAFPGEGIVTMGEGSYVGKNSFIDAHPTGTRIQIGRHCYISHCVQMRTVGYSTWDGNSRGHRIYGNIIIGDGVWIGANAAIRGGITIGEGATVGANAVVLQDVPPNAVAVGVPARILLR